MSAQLFKIFFGVFLAHMIVLSLIWVGFSAPQPRLPASFIYDGAFSAEQASSSRGSQWTMGLSPDQIAVGHFDASYFNHWIELRNPSKSKPYDRLGF